MQAVKFRSLWWATALSCLLWPAATAAMDTAFSYQAVLYDAGSPADGLYDLRFILYDAEVGGSQVGPVLYGDDIGVSDGLFTVHLDFGAGTFAGSNLWLEVAVRPADSTDSYTPLAPRQALLPSPYALHAATIQAAAVGASELAPNSVTAGHIVDGTITASDIDTSSVQARVAATCSEGSAIRTIESDGTVACQVDRTRSIYRAGPFHAESHDGGDVTYNWPKPLQGNQVSLCFLTRVQLRDVDGANENAFCRVTELEFTWELLASTEPSHDNDAMCSMMCLYWW